MTQDYYKLIAAIDATNLYTLYEFIVALIIVGGYAALGWLPGRWSRMMRMIYLVWFLLLAIFVPVIFFKIG